MIYGSLALPSALYPGDSFNSINNESSALYPSGTAGERVALAQPQTGPERDISVEVSFSVNPGAFEIDLQTADTDTTNAYQTATGGTITAASQFQAGGAYYARLELHIKARFARPYVKTQPANACLITITIVG